MTQAATSPESTATEPRHVVIANEGAPLAADQSEPVASSGARLGLQAGVAACTVAALLVGAVYFTGKPHESRLEAPLISAATAPVKYRPAADTIAEDAAPAQLAAVERPLVEAPAIRPPERAKPVRAAAADNLQGATLSSVLTTKVVKTIVIRPYGEESPEQDAADLDRRGAELRQAIATATTPRAVSAATPTAPVQVPQAMVTPTEPMRIAAQPIDPIVTGSIVAAHAPARAIPVAQAAGYFVQLAASESEDEARQKARALQTRLSGNLGARELAVYQGNVKERTVFRVRVAANSRDEANQLCARLKSVNAACFVARE